MLTIITSKFSVYLKLKERKEKIPHLLRKIINGTRKSMPYMAFGNFTWQTVQITTCPTAEHFAFGLIKANVPDFLQHELRQFHKILTP